MGIKDLAKVIGDHAPAAIKENEIKNYFGRKVAIDASMSIYQFLIAVRQDGSQLQTDTGETTSHILGMFYRTIRMVSNGIKPVYVFDGKPPEMKSAELEKRGERRQEAEKALEKAVESGDTVAADKFSRRLVKVTHQHNDDCKRLLGLMGMPYIDAPCEAEAQCAAMVHTNKVYATATEDMDALTFGSSVLLRHMTFSEAKKVPIQEFHLDRVLSAFDMGMDQFIDLCIMLGCDYCGTIRGIGQKKAFELIKTHKTIEAVLEHIDKEKYPPPENWAFEQARKLFTTPDVTDPETVELKWREPDEEGLIQFLVVEKNFSEERIRSALQKLNKGRTSSTQGRIDSFFTSSKLVTSAPTAAKRKALDEKNKGPAKKNSKGSTGTKMRAK